MAHFDDTQKHIVRDDIRDENNPPGENQGVYAEFTVDKVAKAFDVERDRIVRAFSDEFSLDEHDKVDSQQAQRLADVILGDQPQERQEAALMTLGAYTPRRDTVAPSVSEKAPGELDDTRLSPDSRRRQGYFGDDDA